MRNPNRPLPKISLPPGLRTVAQPERPIREAEPSPLRIGDPTDGILFELDESDPLFRQDTAETSTGNENHGEASNVNARSENEILAEKYESEINQLQEQLMSEVDDEIATAEELELLRNGEDRMELLEEDYVLDQAHDRILNAEREEQREQQQDSQPAYAESSRAGNEGKPSSPLPADRVPRSDGSAAPAESQLNAAQSLQESSQHVSSDSEYVPHAAEDSSDDDSPAAAEKASNEVDVDKDNSPPDDMDIEITDVDKDSSPTEEMHVETAREAAAVQSHTDTTISFCALPQWNTYSLHIPKRLCRTDIDVLFTIEDFHNEVVRPVADGLTLVERQAFRVKLNHIENNPLSYMLIVQGDERSREKLHGRLESSYQNWVSQYNLVRLLSDPESLEIDVGILFTGSSPFGLRCAAGGSAPNDDALEWGVFVDLVKPNQALDKILEGHVKGGLAILSVNGKACKSMGDVHSAMMSAPAGDELKVRLCLHRGATIPDTIHREMRGAKATRFADQWKLLRPTLGFKQITPPSLLADGMEVTREIMDDPNSILVKIQVDASYGLGATLWKLENGSPKYPSTLISKVDAQKALANVIAPDCFRSGAVVLSVDGNLVTTAASIGEKIREAKDAGRKVELGLCFPSWTTGLDGIDKSALVHEAYPNPRRRNGQPLVSEKNTHRKRKRSPSAPEVERPSPSDAREAYTRFVAKTRDARLIEFRGTGINDKKVMSKMWEQHKKKFGDHAACEDDCLCLSVLHELSTTVANSEKVANCSGFISHFLPRFVPLLQLEFPDEKPMQIHHRLKNIWRKHTKQQTFGLKCSESCQCNGAWDIVFQKGHGLDDSQGKKQRLAAQDANIPVHGKVSADNPLHEDSEPSRRSYEILCDARNPLGAYFITAKSSDGFQCKVYSIRAKDGQLKKDSRIQKGTVVVSTMLEDFHDSHRQSRGQTKTLIKTHTELKRQYDIAKKKGLWIRLTLINTHVTVASSSSNSFSRDRDWSYSSGVWTGSRHDGWPGGAPDGVLLARSRKSKLGVQATGKVDNASAPNNSRVDGRATTRGETSNTSSPDKPETPVWQDVTSLSEPSHRFSKAPQSILRKGTGCIGKKKVGVHWSLANETRTYQVGSEVGAFQVSTGNETSNNLLVHSADVEQQRDSLLEKELAGIIELLQSPKSASGLSTAYLRNQYDQVKRKLKHLGGKISQDDENMLQQKKIVLNIFLNAFIVLEQAIQIRHWVCFQFYLKCLTLEMPARGLSPNDCQVRGNFQVSGEGGKEEKKHLPAKNLAQHVIYERDESTFVSHNNNRLAENREASFHFYIETNGETGLTNDVGLASTSLSDLEAQFMAKNDGKVQFKELDLPLRITDSKYVTNGRCELEVQRLRASTDYINKKRRVLQGQLDSVLDGIERFRSDTGFDITGNVHGPGKISLLHAAIDLRDTKLVARLLRTGADPLRKSALGTPIHHAMLARDRTVRKLNSFENGEESSSKVVAQCQDILKVQEEYDQIVHLLRDNSGLIEE